MRNTLRNMKKICKQNKSSFKVLFFFLKKNLINKIIFLILLKNYKTKKSFVSNTKFIFFFEKQFINQHQQKNNLFVYNLPKLQKKIVEPEDEERLYKKKKERKKCHSWKTK